GDAGAKQVQDAPGAGADVEEIVDAALAERLDQGLPDLRLVDIEGTQLVPAPGVLAEVVGRGLAAPGADDLEPLAVAFEPGMGLGPPLEAGPPQAAPRHRNEPSDRPPRTPPAGGPPAPPPTAGADGARPAAGSAPAPRRSRPR